MLNGKLYRFKVLNFTGKRAFRFGIRPVALCIARENICTANAVFLSVVRSLGYQFHTRNVIAAGVTVYAVKKGRTVYLPVNNLKFVEKIVVIPGGLITKFKGEFVIACGVAIGVVADCHLDFV